jgi:hypothetical protein
MKCWILLINRERGRLHKRGEYGAEHGIIRDVFHREKMKFLIADKVHPVTLDISTSTAKNRTVPLFVVNEMTKEAIGVSMIEETNSKVDIAIEVLTRRAFWDSLIKKLKLHWKDLLVYMCAGYGLLRFLEYIVRIIVLHQG